MEEQQIAPYANIIIRLLQVVIYEDDRKIWNNLIIYQHQVRQYFAKIGVELHLNEQEGFAYLTQPDAAEDAKITAARLVRRIPLSYEVTLLCVVLREALEEFDVKNTDARKLFVTNQELKDRIELFFGDKADKVKLLERFDNYINGVIGLGFLKEVKIRGFDKDNKTYEVRRIIKAKVSNEKLEEVRTLMKG